MTFLSITLGGALSALGALYFIRAMADTLECGYADGLFHGPYGTGKEFMNWTGADSGYEGTFGPLSIPLYSIAVGRGVITPPDPEWWLADDQGG